MKKFSWGTLHMMMVIATLFTISGVVLYVFGFESMTGKIVVTTFYIGAQVVAIFFTSYQTAISSIGLIRAAFEKKRSSIRRPPNKTFALIVCAHNEQTVVGDLVDNLVHDLDYPRDMYDVYVICDNCTDDTAAMVRAHGGRAMERFDQFNTGKGHALEWMFQNLSFLEQSGKGYDAVCIFDADNLVTSNFLQEMNAKLLEGHEVIQAYLDSKNPRDSWVSKSYAVSYWATNRTFQKIRNGLGLSAQLGGTGMCMTTEILKTIGWGTKSLTEDLEFTAKYVLQTGKPVAWSHEARILDEKPIYFKTTWKQRIRWMIGHVNCAMSQGWPLLQAALFKRKLIYFDIWVYLIQPARTITSLVHLAFICISLFDWMPAELSRHTFSHWTWFAVLTLSYLIPIIGLTLEKRRIQEFFYVLYGYAFAISWLPIVALGIKRRKQREWNPTRHTQSAAAVKLAVDASKDNGLSA